MEPPIKSKAASQIERIKSKDPDLYKSYEEHKAARTTKAIVGVEPETETIHLEEHAAAELQPGLQERMEESIALARLRPVMIIRDNRLVPEFQGPDVTVWKERLMQQEAIINSVIPSIGRVEVNNNAVYKWVGTGWLVDRDIIVTNRHVASIFSRNKEGFSFKVGFPSGLQSANMDFLEEDQRTNSLEFAIESVLWIAPNDKDHPDVAFMRIRRAANSPVFPKPIELAESVDEGEVVVTIGYPARDPDIPDQELVLRIFGNVYDKKRLAPGEVVSVNDVELEHDCSTLGGNSGSPVIQLSTGKAVGLHFAGLYMQGNYAVPAPTVSKLLDQLRQGKLPGMRLQESSTNVSTPAAAKAMTNVTNPMQGVYTLEANIPIKVTLEIGGAVIPGLIAPQLPSGPTVASSEEGNFDQALALARQTLQGQPGIISVEPGYRFRRGWITDERVIAIEVQEKQSLPELRNSGKQLIPQQFLGIGVDIRTAGLPDQLAFLGVDVAGLEAVSRPGVYKEPPNLKLDPVKEKMKAIFHVSPDSGFPNLKAFISRVKSKMTATMYEWDAPHISKVIFDTLKVGNRKLTMVTQKAGTEAAVNDMKRKLGDKFDHVWASVGAGKIVPSAYHIKVASRDDKEFWLSSGNWKDSNQADIDPAGDGTTTITPLRKHNREWHVIIENEKLAKLFGDYIKWDFKEAHRVPLDEAVPEPAIYLFVPEVAFTEVLEQRVVAKYFKPKVVDRVLDVQPLLTPDRNSRGQRIFMDFATNLINGAKTTIDIENQSFNLLDDNESQFERFFTILKNKQDAGVKIRVIFRDPREFSSSNEASLHKLLDRIKDFGIDTDNIKVQKGCHTKAIIVDSASTKAEDGIPAVMFGSHNLTNAGALFNRDASLLIKDKEIAEYYQEIFDFDWEVLATQSAEESIGGVRLAGASDETPPGFRKVSLAEFMGDN